LTINTVKPALYIQLLFNCFQNIQKIKDNLISNVIFEFIDIRSFYPISKFSVRYYLLHAHAISK